MHLEVGSDIVKKKITSWCGTQQATEALETVQESRRKEIASGTFLLKFKDNILNI